MILQGLTTSFKVELLNGYHAFSSVFRAADTFKIALYVSGASLNAATTIYSVTNEISGTGYVAGGKTLVPIAPLASLTVACLSFNPVVWNPASFTANGALIYNSTQGNRAVAILAFGSDKIARNTFTITFPSDDSSNAVIRIT